MNAPLGPVGPPYHDAESYYFAMRGREILSEMSLNTTHGLKI